MIQTNGSIKLQQFASTRFELCKPILLEEAPGEYGGFVYEWINKTVKRHYIGCRSGSIDTLYICSASNIDFWNDFYNEGHVWQRRILLFCETFAEARTSEGALLSKNKVGKDPKYYNLSGGRRWPSKNSIPSDLTIDVYNPNRGDVPTKYKQFVTCLDESVYESLVTQTRKTKAEIKAQKKRLKKSTDPRFYEDAIATAEAELEGAWEKYIPQARKALKTANRVNKLNNQYTNREEATEKKNHPYHDYMACKGKYQYRAWTGGGRRW